MDLNRNSAAVDILVDLQWHPSFKWHNVRPQHISRVLCGITAHPTVHRSHQSGRSVRPDPTANGGWRSAIASGSRDWDYCRGWIICTGARGRLRSGGFLRLTLEKRDATVPGMGRNGQWPTQQSNLQF